MLLAESLLGSSSVEANYIEDVFSTYLYTGTGASQTITNGIDLSGKGGLVWIKRRDGSNGGLFDTLRGTDNAVFSYNTNAQTVSSGALTAFGSNNFSVGASALTNAIGTYVSWTFRKQAKFFDVVTYTGNGANRTIAHNLGSVPGCIIVKCTSDITDWGVYHRSLTSAAYALQLNTTGAQFSNVGYWNSTAPTSSVFSVGTDNDTNANGRTYVAYLFAHDAGGFGASGSDNAITCGSYTGNGSATGPSVTLGYEPQWVLIKRSSASGNDWQLYDSMRGLVTGDGGDNGLFPNSAAGEDTNATIIKATATGFQLETTSAALNASGSTYIYIAIRRGPMKTPTTGTSVFTPVVYSGTGLSGLQVTTNIITDMVIGQKRTGTEVYQHNWTDRLRGSLAMIWSPSSEAELKTADWIQSFALMNGVTLYNDASVNESGTNNHVMYGFRRAPGFFDVVCYTGNGSQVTLNHNLAVAPELVIFKCRSTAATDWVVYRSTATNKRLDLNSSNAEVNEGAFGTFTATTMTLNVDGNINSSTSGRTYVAYLFATVAGVSKVGSYTGSGTTKQIDCGFTGGARFVLIKRTDSTGDWYVWDSARGIVSGNDPYLLLNSTAAEVTNTDYIDTYSAGFEISSTAPAAINASGGSFIFLAIA